MSRVCIRPSTKRIGAPVRSSLFDGWGQVQARVVGDLINAFCVLIIPVYLRVEEDEAHTTPGQSLI